MPKKLAKKPAKKLAEYNRKRIFKKTPEPVGKTKRGTGPLTFIVHLHDATRLHHDLRLEMDGVLKSWAVPRGPSLNPTEQRLAVQVEDHPMEYGKFEGVIPEGNYGAGPVIVWDRGTYRERRSTTRQESEAALKKGLVKGHITFVMDGHKMKGEFALIRLPDGKNWLLIKKGDAYSTYRKVEWDNTSVASKKTLGVMHADKGADRWTRKGRVAGSSSKAPDKGADIQARAVARTGRGALPRVHVMMPVGKRTPPTGAQWIWQKFGEGERAVAQIENGKAELHSRGRLPLHRKHPKLAEALAKLPKSAIIDGEILHEPERFRALDLLWYDGEDFRDQPLAKRLKKLSSLKLPKGVEVAETLKGASDDGAWIARVTDSKYKMGLSAEWIRGKHGHAAATGSTPRVLLTNPTKKLWPKDGFTKKDLFDFYRTVAPFMLPHLKDRPLSLHRFPNGIGSQGFFQKDLTGYLPRSMKTFAHYSGSSSRTIHYALCQDEASLLYLANLACIEINPWMSRVGSIDSPDFCVIDLDPDGNPFPQVIEVALAYKELFDKLKIQAVCKTSGATGLHLVLPWKGTANYDDSREVAIRLSARILQKFPKVTSVERSPAKRRRKIYLDCFQNSRGQTIVAPYSVRPNPGAPVSTPIDWKELGHGIAPSDFTIESVPKRLASKGDPWTAMPGNDLAKTLKKLE